MKSESQEQDEWTELDERIIAKVFAKRWVVYAGSQRLNVRDPSDVFKIENAARLATEEVRVALRNDNWNPGSMELDAVMAACISLMN